VHLKASIKPHVHKKIHEFFINMAFTMACSNFKKGLKMAFGLLGIKVVFWKPWLLVADTIYYIKIEKLYGSCPHFQEDSNVLKHVLFGYCMNKLWIFEVLIIAFSKVWVGISKTVVYQDLQLLYIFAMHVLMLMDFILSVSSIITWNLWAT
jgi:hypothetical protein